MNSIARLVARASFLALLLGGISGLASAHPPYEDPAAIVVDSAGRQLSVVKVYGDGIFFTDPVRLEVRDPTGRVLAGTEMGRDVSLLCISPHRCVVFRYDGLMPIVAEEAWWLDGPTLRKSQSVLMHTLGVVLPLWDHWLGYLVALAFLYLPLAALRRRGHAQPHPSTASS